MSRKRQYALVKDRAIIRDRKGKPIISKMCERPPPLPPRYNNWRDGYSWAEVEDETPPIPHGHELVERALVLSDAQVLRVFRKFESRPINK